MSGERSFLPASSTLGIPTLELLTRTDIVNRPGSSVSPEGRPGAGSNDTGRIITASRLTQAAEGSAFRIVVVPGGMDGSSSGLMVNRGIADQAVRAGQERQEITIPVDAFAHTNANAVVVLSARLANGDPLPDWLVFDPTSGKFVLRTAMGERRTLEVQVEARDSANNVVFTTFKIQVGEAGRQSSLPEKSRRLGLSAQLRMAAQRQHGPLQRLAHGSDPGIAHRTDPTPAPGALPAGGAGRAG
jgi:hypothetical protein